jgi:hypothetical protein
MVPHISSWSNWLKLAKFVVNKSMVRRAQFVINFMMMEHFTNPQKLAIAP